MQTMHPPVAAELLDAWERGSRQDHLQRPLVLLSAALPEMRPETLVGATIGQRDRWLLRLRQSIFGSSMSCLAPCPSCAEIAELELEIAAIIGPTAEPAEESTVLVDGYEVRVRPVTTLDLVELGPPSAFGCRLAESASRLLERCVVRGSHGGEPVSPAELPSHVKEAAADEMASRDGQADIVLELECPSCGASWSAPFDIASFLWSEVAAWAQRTLFEVDLLARVYGWREQDVLALTPWRRERYLEMASQ